MKVLVIGHDGLLGSAVCRALRRRGIEPIEPAIRWGTPDAVTDLAAAYASLPDGEAWVLAWCAGAGIPSSPPAVIDDEVATFTALCNIVRNSKKAANGTLYFTSTAGGVYAGSENPPFSEATPPNPLASYGFGKLAQEAAATALHAAGVRVAIARIANLYGPGQNLSKAQGLVSQLALATQTGNPVGIYVSLDTLRDYIFVDDAATLIVDLILHTAAQPAGSPPIIKILATGSAISIAEILGIMELVTGQAPPVELATSEQSKVQARDLRVKSVVLPELDSRPFTPFPDGVAATLHDVAARWR